MVLTPTHLQLITFSQSLLMSILSLCCRLAVGISLTYMNQLIWLHTGLVDLCPKGGTIVSKDICTYLIMWCYKGYTAESSDVICCLQHIDLWRVVLFERYGAGYYRYILQ